MKNMLHKGWRPVLVLILLFAIWEISCILFDIPAWLLPSPSQIVQEGIGGFPDYAHHVASTSQLALLGFLIGSGFGVIIAIILHLLPKVKEAFYPLIILSQNIPTIVLAPLLVIWFGFGMLPKLIVITLVCFFPVTIAALDGFKQTSPELVHYMKMAGATKKQVFSKLEWPHTLPSLFSGLKISATYSIMGAVISEWLGAKEGIGVYMTLASSSFRTDRVFVAILLIMIMCLIFFALIVIIEKWVVKGKLKGDGKP
jgi:ABC-type nitrate/sulfonate/bicarbonate transport system permease component